MKTERNLINFIIEIRKSFPNSGFLPSLNIFFKLFSLFLLTHDWNIHSNKGISSFLIQMTGVPFINRLNNDMVTIVITLIYIILSIIPIAIILISLIYKDYNERNRGKIIQIASVFIYFIYYLFNQHFYMLSVGSYFCPGVIDTSKGYPIISSIGYGCRGIFNYIIIVLQTLMIIGFIIVNYLISVASFDPFFFSKQLILNNIGVDEIQWIIYPLGLFILNLEYFIPFAIIAMIKIAIRLAYVVFYFVTVLILPKYFFSMAIFNQLHIMILSMCFVSCIIEYVFLYDWDNNLILLQSNAAYIIIKLIIEVLLSISLSYYIQLKDYNILTSVNGFNKKKNIREEYALYNKYFYYILYPFANVQLTEQIIKNVHCEYQTHQKENCSESKNDCFCSKYSSEDIIPQSKTYLFHTNYHKKSMINEYENFKNDFPALYYYLEYYIQKKIDKINSNNSKSYFKLIAALFYLSFYKNVNKSYFYIEEFKKSSLYKKSFVCRVQVQLINEYILVQNQNILKQKSNNFISFSTEFNQLNHFIFIENQIRAAFFNYIEFLHKASELEIIQSKLYVFMSEFVQILNSNHNKFKKILSETKCKLNYLSTKLYLYYQFFYKTIPSEVSELFKDITKEKQNFLSIEEYSILVIKYSNEKGSLFKIEYASDDFHSSLSYLYGDLNNKKLSHIFFNKFEEGYSTYLYEQIQSGACSLVIPKVCFKTKHSECKIFFFMGIILFFGNNLHIFAKIAPIDSVPYSKLDMFLGDNSNYINLKRSKLIEKDSCYIISNESGRVTEIGEDFESFFCLKHKFIMQHKVNIFRDILKQDLSKNHSFITTKLHIVIENIANIIAKELLENNRGNYDMDYHKIKTMQTNLKQSKKTMNLLTFFEQDQIRRPKKKLKEFYYVIFKIQISNDHPISLKMFFRQEMNIGTKQEKIFRKTEEDKNIMTISLPALADNKNDIMYKISLLKQLSMKVLVNYYGVSHKFINDQFDEENSKKNDKFDNNDKTNDKSNRKELNDFDLVESQNNRKEKRHKIIYVNLVIWLIGLLLFFIFYFVIFKVKGILLEKGLVLARCNLFIIVTKKVMISITSSLMSLQMIVNELQPSVIDNEFENTKTYHRKILGGRINDYLNNYQLFREHYYSPNVNMRNHNDLAQEIFYSTFNVTELGVYLTSINQTINLDEVLGYLNMKVSIGFSDALLALVYNQTFVEDNIEYSNYKSKAYEDYDYLTFQSENLVAERIAVYLIENTMTQFKYRIDEFVHIFQKASNDHNDISKNELLYYDVSINLFIFLLIIYQSIVYFQTNKKLFVSYFIAYIHIQYFNNYTMKKALILKNLMDMAIETTFNELKHTKIYIQNTSEENKSIKASTRIIEEDHPLNIHSFVPFVNIANTITSNTNGMLEADDLVEQQVNQTIQGKKMKEKYDWKIIDQSITAKNKKPNQNKTFQKSPTTRGKPPHINSSSSIKMVTNNSINQTTDILSTNEEIVNKNKKILKPKSNSITIFLIILLLICIVAIAIIHFFLIIEFFSTLQTYVKYQSIALQRITTFHELLIIYQISVLKNKEMVFEYKSYGLLNATEDLSYLNSISSHHVFNNTLATFFSMDNEYSHATQIIDHNSNQKSLRAYEDIFNSDNFCEDNQIFLDNNKEFLLIPIFTSISDLSSKELISRCKNIGYGFNSKGFKTSMLSLLNIISKSHLDFISKKVRTEEYNIEMLNIPSLLTYQLQTYRLLDSIFLNYEVCTSLDYQNRYKTLTKYELSFSMILIVFALFLILFYFIYFTLKFKREYKVIDNIEEVLVSSAVF